MHMRDLILATRNRGKSAELRTLLAPLSCRVLDLDEAGIPYTSEEDDVENAATFEENAVAKAGYFSRQSGGRAVLADDSGLCVAALGGLPGVRSRRYSGAVGDDATVSRSNSEYLLRALAACSDRRAEFVCAVAYIGAGAPVVAMGRTAGSILHAPSGSGGFGYDPVFWSEELQLSFGDAPPEAKARVSHRARAIVALVRHLRGNALTLDDG